MTPIWVDPEDVLPFVGAVAGIESDFGKCRALAVVDKNGKTVAVFIFHGWQPAYGRMEISVVSIDRRALNRSALRAAMDYAFGHCQAVIARTDENNTAVRRFCKAAGAEEYLIPRMRGRMASEALFVLTKEAWTKSKFMRQSYEYAPRSDAA